MKRSNDYAIRIAFKRHAQLVEERNVLWHDFHKNEKRIRDLLYKEWMLEEFVNRCSGNNKVFNTFGKWKGLV